ncbi:16S rRNA processing protein RimM [Malaciobacter mytili LMG 24559]|uniref:Ribosome maturation factor RimM n=1 Tax=Malaciobacter mytili LMG 24559 TaxID=1032238 RepID=A0AAX2AG94_9BACT|nr:ribosome maturation factor RimM [Malaciobacter mytili]AXH15778.1 16S rRNA processing protein [Malaciobacter mytili LMG 24559]RXK15402.1 16S rRNA processing protein RimM [Malaciobacter mytili LMG 24559]
MTEDKIYVAKLGKTVGLKGDLKLHIDSDFPNQFKKGATFTTNRNLTLKVLNYNNNNGTIKFETYEDIDLAKKLINQELFTSKEATKDNCQLEENQHFWFDIIDCEIIEKNIVLGKVKEIHRYPITDYLEVTTSMQLVEKNLPKTFLIPYILDTYITNVDVQEKKIFTQDCFDILENS